MNIGMYQSASALSSLERWQDSVSQNIASGQTTGYRKRTVNFSTDLAGELHTGSRSRIGSDSGVALSFPKTNHGISFVNGETHPTRRELDVAIQGEGFFEVQRPDGTKLYSRSGEFQVRNDRTLVNGAGHEVLSDGGAPITLLPGGGSVTIQPNGMIFQGENSIGKLSIQKFASNAALTPVSGGSFTAGAGSPPERVETPELMQGYLEGSNVSALREMVDLVVIARAYEANEKMIKTMDDQMEKTLNALG
jgi:flagellar basal-body rod protein FlgF